MSNQKLQVMCDICTDKESKYKCPKCPSRYCSVDCFQKHKGFPKQTETLIEEKKDIPQTQGDLQKQEDPQKQEVKLPTPFIDSDGIFRIPYELLQTLGNSPELKEALQNGDLQNLIRKIDGSKNPRAEFEQSLKNNPEFEQVTNLMLQVIGVRDSEGRFIS